MARLWNRFLEQESEHQWLAMGGFFIFIIIGAVLIKGTSSLPGTDLQDNYLENNARIIETQHFGDESYDVIFQNGENKLYWNNNGISQMVNFGEQQNGEASFDFMTRLHNDSVVIPTSDGNLSLINQGIAYKFGMDFASEEYGIKELTQSIDANKETYLIITDEITDEGELASSLRGYNSTGIISSATPNDQNINWEKAYSLDNGNWIATGTYTSNSANDGNSPAAPKLRPAFGLILWNEGFTAPMVVEAHIGLEGEYHTVIAEFGDQAIIAGTHETIVFNHQSRSIENIDFSSHAAISDGCNSAWLVNGKDSKLVMRWQIESVDNWKLSHPLPIEIDSIGYDGDTIHINGVNDNGDSKTLTIDTTAIGSIESGRGFLNFSFIVISLIIMAVMATNVIEKFKDD